MIRNAGGRASDDAIRSLVISYKLLGTKEWFVIHHTNCGMEFFTDEVMRGLLATASRPRRSDANGFNDVGTGPGSAEGDYIDWLTIRTRRRASRRRGPDPHHPLVPATIPIYGYIYDVNGRLVEVEAATTRSLGWVGLLPPEHLGQRELPVVAGVNQRTWGRAEATGSSRLHVPASGESRFLQLAFGSVFGGRDVGCHTEALNRRPG